MAPSVQDLLLVWWQCPWVWGRWLSGDQGSSQLVSEGWGLLPLLGELG